MGADVRQSSHSARVGAAQDMAAAGIDILALMQAGGWQSPNIVGRYIRKLDVLRGGEFQLASQQQEFGQSGQFVNAGVKMHHRKGAKPVHLM